MITSEQFMKNATPLAPEIIWFTPSESYLADPTDTLQLVGESSLGRGLLGAYYGFDEQEPDTGVWVMAWHSLAAHQDFMAHEAYPDFAFPVMEAMVGSGDITQVLLPKQSTLLQALASPITQFIYVTLRPRHNRTYELTPLIERLHRELQTVQGCYGSSWGPSVEHDNVYVGIVGWRCLADRDQAVQGVLAPTIALIQELTRIELKYARLTLYQPE